MGIHDGRDQVIQGRFLLLAQLFSPGPTWSLSAHILRVERAKPSFEEYPAWPKLRLNGEKQAGGGC